MQRVGRHIKPVWAVAVVSAIVAAVAVFLLVSPGAQSTGKSQISSMLPSLEFVKRHLGCVYIIRKTEDGVEGNTDKATITIQADSSLMPGGQRIHVVPVNGMRLTYAQPITQGAYLEVQENVDGSVTIWTDGPVLVMTVCASDSRPDSVGPEKGVSQWSSS